MCRNFTLFSVSPVSLRTAPPSHALIPRDDGIYRMACSGGLGLSRRAPVFPSLPSQAAVTALLMGLCKAVASDGEARATTAAAESLRPVLFIDASYPDISGDEIGRRRVSTPRA